MAGMGNRESGIAEQNPDSVTTDSRFPFLQAQAKNTRAGMPVCSSYVVCRLFRVAKLYFYRFHTIRQIELKNGVKQEN